MTTDKKGKGKSPAKGKFPGMTTKKLAVPPEEPKAPAKPEVPVKGNVRMMINPKIRADSATFGQFKGVPGDILEIPASVAAQFADWMVDGVKVLIDAPRTATLPPKDTGPDEG